MIITNSGLTSFLEAFNAMLLFMLENSALRI
jgi:hypothetical protein